MGPAAPGAAPCVVACKEEKGVPDGVWLRKRYENVHDFNYITQGCNHCDDPACASVCPVKAYHKDADGLVIQDHAKCIGCGACQGACRGMCRASRRRRRRCISATPARRVSRRV